MAEQPEDLTQELVRKVKRPLLSKERPLTKELAMNQTNFATTIYPVMAAQSQSLDLLRSLDSTYDPKKYDRKVRRTIPVIKNEKKAVRLSDCIGYESSSSLMIGSKDLKPRMYRIRCGLKRHCPKCFGPHHIVAARTHDFERLQQTAEMMGAGEFGESAKVWLVSLSTGKRPRAARLTRALNGGKKGSKSRHQPMMVGQWGGELVCGFVGLKGPHKPTYGPNSPTESGSSFLFNMLLVGSPENVLDEARLAELLPGCKIEHYHGNLATAWSTYLLTWSLFQLGHRSKRKIAAWIDSGIHNFSAIGEFRALKARIRKQHYDELHKQSGHLGRLGCCSSREDPESAIERYRRNLPCKLLDALGYQVPVDVEERILCGIKPLVHHHLDRPIRQKSIQQQPTQQPAPTMTVITAITPTVAAPEVTKQEVSMPTMTLIQPDTMTDSELKQRLERIEQQGREIKKILEIRLGIRDEDAEKRDELIN